jgi:hypothetical protein
MLPMPTTAIKRKAASSRGWILNLVLIFASILMGVAIAETLMRRVYAGRPFSPGYVGQYQNRPSRNFIPDRQTGWRMRPSHEFTWITEDIGHTYRSNTQGFRAAADFTAADPRKKIALVGDSYTFGAGVDFTDTFGAVLQRKSPTRVIYNLGMPGFGIDQVWMSVRHQAIGFKPDLIVAGIVDADFERSLVPYRAAEGFNKPTFKLVNKTLAQRTQEAPPNSLVHFLEEHSSIWAVTHRLPKWLGRKYPIGGYYRLNEAILAAMMEDCRLNSVPVLFVYIPTSEFQPFPALAGYMRRIGANYIDLTEIRPAPPHSIYLPRDGHLSVEGHRYVAALIDGWIHDHMPSR